MFERDAVESGTQSSSSSSSSSEPLLAFSQREFMDSENITVQEIIPQANITGIEISSQNEITVPEVLEILSQNENLNCSDGTVSKPVIIYSNDVPMEIPNTHCDDTDESKLDLILANQSEILKSQGTQFRIVSEVLVNQEQLQDELLNIKKCSFCIGVF